VKEWAEIWLETYKEPAMSARGYKSTKSAYTARVAPVIGTMRLADVKPIHCQRILNDMSGLSKKHIKRVHEVMRAMFDAALDNGLLLLNPALKLTRPAAEDGTHRAITNTERAALIRACEENERAKKYSLWVKFMLYCGLRPDETARVKGHHIDIKNKRLYIDGTKSKAAKRYVPIPEELINELKETNFDPFGPVFATKQGKPLTESARKRHWQVIIRAMNIAMGCETHKGAVVPPYRVADDLVPYCLRHTYGTDLQDAGVPINIAKDLMGHEDIATTANIYTHTSEAAFERAREMINEANKRR
jgi:integrase